MLRQLNGEAEVVNALMVKEGGERDETEGPALGFDIFLCVHVVFECVSVCMRVLYVWYI